MLDNEYRLQGSKVTRSRDQDKIILEKFEEIFFFVKDLNRDPKNMGDQVDQVMARVLNEPKLLDIYKIYKFLIKNRIGEIFTDLGRILVNFHDLDKAKKLEEPKPTKKIIFEIVEFIEGKRVETLEFENLQGFIVNNNPVINNIEMKINRQDLIKSDSKTKEDLIKDFKAAMEHFRSDIEKERQIITDIGKAEKFEIKSSVILYNLMRWFMVWSNLVEIHDLELKKFIEEAIEPETKREASRLYRKEQTKTIIIGDDKLNELFFFHKAGNRESVKNGKEREKQVRNELKNFKSSESELFETYKSLIDTNIGGVLINLGRRLVRPRELEKAARIYEINSEKARENDMIRFLLELEDELKRGEKPKKEQTDENIKIKISELKCDVSKAGRLTMEKEIYEAFGEMNLMAEILEQALENFYQNIIEKKQKIAKPYKADLFEMVALLELLGFVGCFEKWVESVETDNLALKAKMKIFTEDLVKRISQKISPIELRCREYFEEIEEETSELELKKGEIGQIIKPDLTPNYPQREKKSCLIM